MATERFYLSGDLRSIVGIPRTTLDFYIRKQLVVPTNRSENGFLLFSEADLARLLRIVEWRRQGYGLREIRRLLEQGEQKT